MDYRCKDMKICGKLKGDTVPLNRPWLPLSENPDHHTQKMNCLIHPAFKPVFEIVKF